MNVGLEEFISILKILNKELITLKKKIDSFRSSGGELILNFSSETGMATVFYPNSTQMTNEKNHLQKTIEKLLPGIRMSLAILTILKTDKLFEIPESILDKLTLSKVRLADFFAPAENPINDNEIKAARKKLQEDEELFKKSSIEPKYTIQNFEKMLRRAASKAVGEDVVHILKTAGVDVNARDENPTSRKTALHLAVLSKANHSDAINCAYILKAYGADDTILDAQGKSPADYRDSGDIKVTSFGSDPEELFRILERKLRSKAP